MEKITKHKIYEAYRKLKNYYYYDNTALTIRYKIAEFEKQFYTDSNLDFDQRFDAVMDGGYKIVNGEDKGDSLLESLLNQIKFVYITKSMENTCGSGEICLYKKDNNTIFSINNYKTKDGNNL